MKHTHKKRLAPETSLTWAVAAHMAVVCDTIKTDSLADTTQA